MRAEPRSGRWRRGAANIGWLDDRGDIVRPAARPGDLAPGSVRRPGNYDLIVALFCGLLLISNIGATKLIEFGPIITDGGAFLFPLTYILGDVLSEVYGFRKARRAILLGFGLAILAALTFWLVQIAPAGRRLREPGGVRGGARLRARGSCWPACAGSWPGSCSTPTCWSRSRSGPRRRQLWARLIGSTLVGELADTVVFCTIAFYGVITGGDFLNYVITGYVYKVLVEVVLLPVTYPVIGLVKRHEPNYVPGAAVGRRRAAGVVAGRGSPPGTRRTTRRRCSPGSGRRAGRRTVRCGSWPASRRASPWPGTGGARRRGCSARRCSSRSRRPAARSRVRNRALVRLYRPLLGVDRAVAGDPGRRDAVEGVGAVLDRGEHVVRFADAQQVPRLVLRAVPRSTQRTMVPRLCFSSAPPMPYPSKPERRPGPGSPAGAGPRTARPARRRTAPGTAGRPARSVSRRCSSMQRTRPRLGADRPTAPGRAGCSSAWCTRRTRR